MLGMLLSVLYVVLAVLWGVFSVHMQLKLHGRSWWRVPLVFILNTMFFPICVGIAIFKREGGSTDA